MRRQENLFTLAARLPWWANLVLALVVYLCIGKIAPALLKSHSNPASPLAPAVFLAPLLSAVSKFFALVFIIAAATSGIVRLLRKNPLSKPMDFGAIKNLDWYEFERLIGEFYRRKSYVVTEEGGARPDGGIDLILHKKGAKTLVQCKHWKAYKVDVKVVREMYGILVAESASEAIVITSGDFT